ncbi:MAG: DeoR/GlpR family DNA-binding transcription regulator [Actinobacteria bacterium]|nr:DeoR/GlpR family DNA-binding transcription regulator [Actinomycetota bacterium]
MLSEERREYISELLKEFGSVSIKDLSLKLGVSIATIRRDLDKLANKKLLKRTFGGAISHKIIKRELNFETKKDVNIEEKKKIALIASKYIENGDTIFIESGTTCVQLCFNLSNKKNLTIITNSPDIAITTKPYR